jgi:hypothetical protein
VLVLVEDLMFTLISESITFTCLSVVQAMSSWMQRMSKLVI